MTVDSISQGRDVCPPVGLEGLGCEPWVQPRAQADGDACWNRPSSHPPLPGLKGQAHNTKALRAYELLPAQKDANLTPASVSFLGAARIPSLNAFTAD